MAAFAASPAGRTLITGSNSTVSPSSYHFKTVGIVLLSVGIPCPGMGLPTGAGTVTPLLDLVRFTASATVVRLTPLPSRHPAPG